MEVRLGRPDIGVGRPDRDSVKRVRLTAEDGDGDGLSGVLAMYDGFVPQHVILERQAVRAVEHHRNLL